MKTFRLIAGAAVAIATTLGAASFAGAAPATNDVPAGYTLATPGVQETSLAPVNDPKLDAYLKTLSPSAQTEYKQTMIPVKLTTVTGKVEPATTAQIEQIKQAGGVVSPRTTGCYSVRITNYAKALAGNTLWTNYHTGGWCASGNTATSASVIGAGGETFTIGWRWEGTINKESRVLGNLGISWSQQKFVAGTAGVDIQWNYPCLKVQGRVDGQSYKSTDCGI